MLIFQLKRKHNLLAVCVCVSVPVEQQGLVDFSNMLLRSENKTGRCIAPTGCMGTWHVDSLGADPSIDKTALESVTPVY